MNRDAATSLGVGLAVLLTATAAGFWSAPEYDTRNLVLVSLAVLGGPFTGIVQTIEMGRFWAAAPLLLGVLLISAGAILIYWKKRTISRLLCALLIWALSGLLYIFVWI